MSAIRTRDKFTPEEVKERIGPILKKLRPSLRLALLFGSVAEGCTRADSDIDLGVLDTTQLSGETLLSLVSDVSEQTGWETDVVDLYGVPYPITRSAVKGICLFGSDDCYVEFCRRYLIEKEDFGRLQERLINERLNRWIR